MVELRSGTRTQGDEGEPRTPSSTASVSIPRDIEVTPTRPEVGNEPTMSQEDTQQPIPQTPEVYVAGTYARSFTRMPGRSPSEPPNFRPAQFAFLPQPDQPDYRTAQEPSEGEEIADQGQTDENQPATANNATQQPIRPRILRSLVFSTVH